LKTKTRKRTRTNTLHPVQKCTTCEQIIELKLKWFEYNEHSNVLFGLQHRNRVDFAPSSAEPSHGNMADRGPK
jgi:hypothetical protein